jgi:lipopolysaccharide export system permease protein
LALCAWIVQSSRYLWILNNNSIGLIKFLKFTSYLSIDIISVIFPISLAIAAAFVYQRFNGSNQLIALQAAGFSPIKILSPLMHMIIIVVGYLYISNTCISPNAWKNFRFLEFEIRNNIDPPEKAGAIFSSNGFSVYAQKYRGDFFFENIFIVDARNPERVYGYFAQSGTIKDNTLILTRGERMEVGVLDHRNSIMYFQSYNYNLSEILKIEKKSTQPNEKYIHELLQKNEDESTSKLQRALFHQKITSPLLAIVFPMFSFLLTVLAPYSRRFSYVRMMILMIIILVFQGSYFWITHAAAKNSEFTPLNYLLMFFAIITPIILIIRKRKL